MRPTKETLLATLVTWLLAASAGAQAAPAPAMPPLTARERDTIRYQLDSIFNEADLAIRNQKADKEDLAKLHKDADRFRLYERFPQREAIPQLKITLSELADREGLEVKSLKVVGRAPDPQPVPAQVFVDQPRYRFSQDQLVQWIDVELVAEGDLKKIKEWIRSWPGRHLRWIEPLSEPKSLGDRQYRIKARTYRFRSFEFPRIVFRDPALLLPAAARADTEAFAEKEPTLWKLVSRTRELIPEAQELFDLKRRLIAEHARMEFYLSKVLPAEAKQGHAH